MYSSNNLIENTESVPHTSGLLRLVSTLFLHKVHTKNLIAFQSLHVLLIIIETIKH